MTDDTKACKYNELESVKNEASEFDNNESDVSTAKASQLHYSNFYRVLRTALLAFIWMSVGFNIEIFGPALEDFRILLDIDYEHIAFILIMRSSGNIIMTAIMGLILDRILHYSNIIIIVAKFLFIVPTLIVTWTKTYWIALALFLIQGMANAVIEVSGSEAALRLWHGVSNSPINAVYGGYGIGGCLGVLIIRKFIKFNPYNSKNLLESNTSEILSLKKTIYNQSEAQNSVTSNDIKLQIPFSIAGLFGLLVIICFICTEIIEHKCYKEVKKSAKLAKSNKDIKKHLLNNKKLVVNKKLEVVSRVILNKKFESKSEFYITIVQVLLLMLLCAFISGFIAIQSSYMITYLTKGPAKITVEDFFIFQMLFWAFYVIGRFLIAYIGFKMETSKIFSIILLINLILTIMYSLTYLNKRKSFYWFIIVSLAITSGPLIPSAFMIAKHTLHHINSVLVSIFSISMSLGYIISQYLTGYLLDKLQLKTNWLGYENATSIYVIPYVLLLFIFSSCLIYFLIFIIYHLWGKKFHLQQ